MRQRVLLCIALVLSSPALANNWEKFYKPAAMGSIPILPSDQAAEVVGLTESPDALVNTMWRKGYALIGSSAFNSPNSNTKDALRLADKLKARFVVLGTALASSSVVSIPITTPTTSTTYSNGNVSAYGSGGAAHGSYSGTSTTYGSQTSYIPIVKNRFDKLAAYFGPIDKKGVGILFREPSTEEMQTWETRRALIVLAVREGSPADKANILEGDAILTINGLGADRSTLSAASRGVDPVKLHLIRNGQLRNLELAVPEEWRLN